MVLMFCMREWQLPAMTSGQNLVLQRNVTGTKVRLRLSCLSKHPWRQQPSASTSTRLFQSTRPPIPLSVKIHMKHKLSIPNQSALMAPPTKKALVSALNNAVDTLWKQQRDNVTITNCRARAEQDLDLEEGFFTDPKWKAESKSIIKDRVVSLLTHTYLTTRHKCLITNRQNWKMEPTTMKQKVFKLLLQKNP